MRYLSTIGFILMLMTLSGCEAVGDIFSAGVYTGIIIVVVVIIVIVMIIAKLGKRG